MCKSIGDMGGNKKTRSQRRGHYTAQINLACFPGSLNSDRWQKTVETQMETNLPLGPGMGIPKRKTTVLRVLGSLTSQSPPPDTSPSFLHLASVRQSQETQGDPRLLCHVSSMCLGSLLFTWLYLCRTLTVQVLPEQSVEK